MKPYSYSVKEILQDCFGEDAIFHMRSAPRHASVGQKTSRLEYMWRYADDVIRSCFSKGIFLTDTSIDDDYIVYNTICDGERQVYLLLAQEETDALIDVEYADSLLRHWTAMGYSAFLATIRINIAFDSMCGLYRYRTVSDEFYFCKVTISGNRKYLESVSHPCWALYDHKFAQVTQSNDLAEWECLFDPCVTIYHTEKGRKITDYSGFDEVRRFLTNEMPVRVVLMQSPREDIYVRRLISNTHQLDIYVGLNNQISKIELRAIDRAYIALDDTFGDLCLKDAVPAIREIRPLDARKMHGLALQLRYSDSSLRNYYLEMYDTLIAPVSITIDGYTFDEKMLATAALNEYGDIAFDNGYMIPRHILYYRGYRQVEIEQTDYTFYEDETMTIRSRYREPLIYRNGVGYLSRYHGNQDECWGPSYPALDEYGNRVTDVSSPYEIHLDHDLDEVVIEPSGKRGLLRADGSWELPPVFVHDIDRQWDDVAFLYRYENEKRRTYLYTTDHQLVSLDFVKELERFPEGNRRAFSTGKWEGTMPNYRGYYSEDCTSGTWGYLDKSGNVVIQPQYLFAISLCDSHDVFRAYVATVIDGKLRWGLIDENGNDIIPCKYADLFSPFDAEVVVFQREDGDLYGMMDLAGNVIMEPRFACIKEYDPDHRLVSAGPDEDSLGAYSVDTGEQLIPEKYDDISYGDYFITAELPFSSKDIYYDYSGAQTHQFDQYDMILDYAGKIEVYKGDQKGVLDPDGNVIIPLSRSYALQDAKELYERGLQKSGDNNKMGLQTLTGDVILPEEYSSVEVRGSLVTASSMASGTYVETKLFTVKGTQITTGPCHHICIDKDSRNMTIETPLGKEHFEIIHKEVS